MSEIVEMTVRDGVAVVTLNRPEKLNAINDAMQHALLEAIGSVASDDAVGAAVLHGRGRAFSTGADISGLESKDDAGFAATIDRFMAMAHAFRDCPKPIVAAIHGYALAGGFELALLCDVRMAAEGTVFGLPDTPLGLSPTSGMTWLLPRIVGLGQAMHLTLSADNIDAAEALRIGLVTKVTPAEALLGTAEAYARAIARHPRIGVERTKAGFLASLSSGFAEATEREAADELACFRTPEVRERFRGFINRKRG